MSVLKTQKEEEVETKTKGGSFVLKTGNQNSWIVQHTLKLESCKRVWGLTVRIQSMYKANTLSPETK